MSRWSRYRQSPWGTVTGVVFAVGLLAAGTLAGFRFAHAQQANVVSESAVQHVAASSMVQDAMASGTADRGTASGEKRALEDELRHARGLSRVFSHVSETITPSVVNISSTRRLHASARSQSPMFDSPFRDFFGDPFFERFFGPNNQGQERVQRGLGTGVVVDAKGHILTNNHVVQDADEVVVRFADGRSFDATVVGTDPKTDLAVLRVEGAKDLKPATLGNSDDLAIGEWVIAAGNPFGLASSITAGIVSAKGRANVGLAEYEDFIQTDAAINPGNSGGPLVNLRGEVVGINTAIVTRSGGYMGVGFAIPINMARSIMQSLIDDGRVVRGWLGVVIQELDEGLAKSFGYGSTDGVLIGDVTPDGPGDKAGVQSGDIVKSYDGHPVSGIDKLRARVAGTKPGTKIALEIFRDGKTRTLQVEIGELEAEVAVGRSKPESVDLGMTVRTLTPQLASQLGQDEEATGVVVTDVEPIGPAARAGLRPRDVIVAVQGQNVADVAGFRAELKKHDLEKGVRLSVRRGSTGRYVFLRASKNPS